MARLKVLTYNEERAIAFKKLKKRGVRLNMRYYDKQAITLLATTHKVRFSIMKGFVRAEMRRPRPQWRLETYNGLGWVHHTTHYKYGYAIKTAHTAARRNPFGWVRLVDNATGAIPSHFMVAAAERGYHKEADIRVHEA